MATYGERHKYASAMDPIWANAYLGATTSIEPGKAMKDLINLPASGIENVEISVIDPSKFEAIPREMFAEARRAGRYLIKDFIKEGRPTPISLHSPLVEPTGFAENKWDEGAWKSASQQLAGVVEKAALLGPSVPVTIHGSHVPSVQTRYDQKEADRLRTELEVSESRSGTSPEHQQLLASLKQGIIPQMMTVVDPISGELKQMTGGEQYLAPGIKHFVSPQEHLRLQNERQWENMQRQIMAIYTEGVRTEQLIAERESQGKNADFLKKSLQTYSDELSRAISGTYDHVARADPNAFKRVPEAEQALKQGDVLGALLAIPANKPPILLQPTEDFAREKAAETFANVAMRSYDIATHPEKFMDKERVKELQAAGVTDISKAPIITIENVYPEAAFGRGESMRQLIEASRNKFAEKLVQERRLPQARAKEVAKNLIGTTWDVGHINLLRKYGYSEEKITEEIKKVAKDIKHVHLTDNFGSYDAHLAPGMGNVPIKDMLEHIKKGGKIPPEIRGIVEAGGYVMSFGDNPTLKTLQYFNAPVYGFQSPTSWGGESPIGGTYFMGSSGYSAGYGMMLPPIHYGEYGAGFTGLPTALGAVPGVASKSAFAGTPNA